VDQLLGSVELQFTLVGDTVLKRLAEPIELQGSDPAKQKIKDRLLCLTKPAIRSFEGHAFYDRLHRHWWKLPMIHFWMTVSTMYAMVLSVFVPLDLSQSTKRPQHGFKWCHIPIYVVSGICYWRLLQYFIKSGVSERLSVQTIRLQSIFDRDMTQIAMLAMVSIVPFLQPTGQILIADLMSGNPLDSIFNGIDFLAKAIAAFLILISYPGLTWMSSIILVITISIQMRHLFYTSMNWSQLTQEYTREERAHALRRLRSWIVVLLLALTVFIWYFHLSRDTNNYSATVSLYWTEAGLLPLSLELGLLTLVIVLGNLAGVLYAIVVIAYAEFRGYFGRIHLRLPVRNMEHL
jgi:hypothetical protein